MRLRRSRRPIGWEVNIAPLIDVVFQLIIYGLVVSLITRVEVENISLPQAKKGEEGREALARRIVVNVPKNGQIIVSGQSHSVETLQHMLGVETAKADAGSLTVLLRGDREADWKYLAQIMSSCAAKGIGRVHVAVLGPEDSAAATAGGG